MTALSDEVAAYERMKNGLETDHFGQCWTLSRPLPAIAHLRCPGPRVHPRIEFRTVHPFTFLSSLSTAQTPGRIS